MKHIHVAIGPDGTTTIETDGFTGEACLDATAGIKRALGGVVASEVKTAEFFDESVSEADPAKQGLA